MRREGKRPEKNQGTTTFKEQLEKQTEELSVWKLRRSVSRREPSTASHALERLKNLRTETCTGFRDMEISYDLGESAPNGWRQKMLWWLGDD